MNFNNYIPTRFFFGSNCIRNNSAVLAQYGSRAFVVTGRHSAKACGALGDMVEALSSQGIEYNIFDEIENNPSIETISRAGALARKSKADFIIGIGGGSPLDASKAVAVLAANQISAEDLFKNSFHHPLPILCVPTTAGTGSEATQYSVILRHDLKTKVSIGTAETFPSVAFLDSRYTSSLSRTVTVDTAIDAFTHALEGYLAKRSTPICDCLALEAIGIFGRALPALLNDQVDIQQRDKLLYMSMLGGMIISQTGVTIAHGMGYCYTYFKNIPHGRANGFLMREYLKFNYSFAHEKIDGALALLGQKDIEAFDDTIEHLIGKPPVLSDEEIERYTDLSILQKGSIKNNIRPTGRAEILSIWKANAGK